MIIPNTGNKLGTDFLLIDIGTTGKSILDRQLNYTKNIVNVGALKTNINNGNIPRQAITWEPLARLTLDDEFERVAVSTQEIGKSFGIRSGVYYDDLTETEQAKARDLCTIWVGEASKLWGREYKKDIADLVTKAVAN